MMTDQTQEPTKMRGRHGRTVLEASGLHRSLGHAESRTHVLKGVDLALTAGRTYSVVGPSGCGKSTLLYLLGLLDRPDSGEILVDGRTMAQADDFARTRARNESIGFVFQFHFLLPEFTAQENVMLPMRKLGRLSEAQMRDRAAELLEGMGLGDKLARSADHLSGGEQQRVAIARALANDPVLILADEPTGNLDARNSDIVFNYLTKVAKERGQALLMVSHNVELAARCDCTLPMRDGRFEQEPVGN